MFKPSIFFGVASLTIYSSLAVPTVSFAQETENKIEELVITSNRIPTPLRQIATSISVLNAEQIQLKGYSSLVDVLRTLPGISVSNSGGAGMLTSLQIRGESGFRTLFMIDGIKVSDPTGTQVGAQVQYLLAGNHIERVEVLRGPQGFSYGADAGGVVNIFTRRTDQGYQGDVTLEVGEYGTQKIDGHLSAGNDSGDVFFSFADMQTDGFNSRTDDVIERDKDGYENTTLHFRAGWNASERIRLEFVAHDTDAEAEFDRCGFPAINDCVSNFEQTNTRLSLNYSGERFTHHIAFANTDVDRENIAAGSTSFSTAGEINRIEYLGHYQVSGSANLVYGLDFEEEAIVSGSGDDLDRDQRAVYIEYQDELVENLFFTVGARHDDNDDFGTHLSYRFSGAYVQDLASGSILKYRATYGNGFRAPSLSELAYNNGPFAYPPASDTQLKEETSQGYDIGIEFYGANDLHLELVYFDQDIEDEIFFDLASFSGYLQASGTSESKGVELSIDYPLNPKWSLSANLTLNETETPDGDSRIRKPGKLANLGVQFTSGSQKLKILASVRLAGDSENEIFGIGRVKLDDYEVFDISANYRLNDNIKLFGRIENITDEDYEEVTGFNSAGSSVYLGATFTF